MGHGLIKDSNASLFKDLTKNVPTYLCEKIKERQTRFYIISDTELLERQLLLDPQDKACHNLSQINFKTHGSNLIKANEESLLVNVRAQ